MTAGRTGMRAAWGTAGLRGIVLAVLLLLAACGTATTPTTRPAGQATATATAVATATTAATAQVSYVALGASDAVGTGSTDPARLAYVPLLIARLPQGARALNLGVSGILLHQALTRELPSALAANPTVVTVWLVGNDFRNCSSLTQYAADLESLLTQLGTQTRARVFVANTPDMSLLPYFQQGAPQGGACVQGKSQAEIRALAQRWNAVINPIVARHNMVLVDLFNSDLASHPEYVALDGFHPSDAGYRVLADLFWQQIAKAGAVPTG